MQDRWGFMRHYETYLAAINALQTQWSGAFAMPVGGCVESRTKRMIARYEFVFPPNEITESQWIQYFKQANTPSYVDYLLMDEAMKKLQMGTQWPEPESRMMKLQANMEAVPDRFNITDVVFEHEQNRLVGYLAKALAPAGFRGSIATRLTLKENKRFKNEVVFFCAWVTGLMKKFMTWENTVQRTGGSNQQQGGSGRGGSQQQGGHRGRV